MTSDSKRLHITHVASGDLWAGAEVQLYHLAKQLNGRTDIACDVVLLNPGELARRLESEGVPVTVLDESQMSPWRLARELVRHVRRIDPDVIHSHRRKENVLAALARPFASHCRGVRTLHGMPGKAPGYRLDQHLYNLADWIVGRFFQDQCVAVSEDLGWRLGPRFGGRIRVIENGIDIERIREAARGDAALPSTPGRIRIGAVGRLVEGKRIDILVDAAASLKASSPGKHAFFVFGDGPLNGVIERRIAEKGVEDTVFLMGFQEQLPAALGAMDVMVMPSDYEGLPMAILEAMALGVPVVAHAVGGIPTALRHGEAGWLVSEQNPESYAAILRAYADEPGPFRAKAEYARRLVSSSYSSRATADAYAGMYREVNAGPGGGLSSRRRMGRRSCPADEEG